MRNFKLPPAILALLLQALAFFITAVAVRYTDLEPDALTLAIFCGLIAALLSRIAKLARWWIYIQLGFAPALILMLTLQIPPYFFLAAFVIMLTVYWSSYRTQVPLYLSSNKVWQALEGLLPAEGPFRFIDLGSGLGGVLTHLARTRPNGHYEGVEYAPLPAFLSWLRVKPYRNCEVHWGSYWDCDLAQYDVVFAYLSPVPMEQLWVKAKSEMRKGSLFVSSTFAVPDLSPHQTLQVDDLHHSTLLIWRM